MNDNDFQQFKDMTQEIRMNEDFKQALEARLRKAYSAQNRTTNLPVWWRYVAASIIFAAVIALTPFSGLAQQILEVFFTRHQTDQSQVVAPQVTSPSVVWFDAPTVTDVETTLDMNLKEIDPPHSYILQQVSYTPSPLQVTVVYSAAGRNLIFTQGHVGWATDSTVGVSATVYVVTINGAVGEYVEGFWIDGGETNQWSNRTPFHRLRWQEEEMQYEIFATGGSEDTAGIDLIALAESMN